jgi:hypothetical protein
VKYLRSLIVFAVFASTAFSSEQRQTMCVKQKDGTYKCKASGKIEKEPCCDTPTNGPAPAAKPKK